MSDSNMLFWSGDASSARDGHVEQTARQAYSIPDDTVLTGDHERLASEIAAGGVVRVPALDRQNISYTRGKQSVERENVWGERSRMEQAVVHFRIPFEGEADLFKLRPSTFDSAPPYARVERDHIIVTMTEQQDAELLKRELDRTLDHIEQYLGWHKPIWEGVEAQVNRQVVDILQGRKLRLEQERSTDDALTALGFKPGNGS